MKLVRFGNRGEEKTGILLNESADGNLEVADLSSIIPDFDENFFRNDGLAKLKKEYQQIVESAPKVKGKFRLGAPVARPANFICIGLNYKEHAKESGAAIPTEPIIFMKHTGSYNGPFDNVVIPKESEQTDWEVELGIVIGKDAHNVKAKDAYQYIAGYCVINDVSERFWQLKRGSQWDKGKGFPSFSPTGPYLVTTDEIPDPHNLEMWLEVNGKRMQTGNTNDMIFDIPTIVEYVSTCYGLIAGDIITTGTPPGVGLGMTPNVFFKSGDVVRLGIEKLGVSQQNLVAA